MNRSDRIANFFNKPGLRISLSVAAIFFVIAERVYKPFDHKTQESAAQQTEEVLTDESSKNTVTEYSTPDYASLFRNSVNISEMNPIFAKLRNQQLLTEEECSRLYNYSIKWANFAHLTCESSGLSSSSCSTIIRTFVESIRAIEPGKHYAAIDVSAPNVAGLLFFISVEDRLSEEEKEEMSQFFIQENN